MLTHYVDLYLKITQVINNELVFATRGYAVPILLWDYCCSNYHASQAIVLITYYNSPSMGLLGFWPTLPSWKERRRRKTVAYELPCCLLCLSLSVCPPLQLMNQVNDFQEVWYERYAFGGYPNAAIFNLLQLVITTWRTWELVGREQH